MPQLPMARALNAAIREEMRRDDGVVVLGEDVGKKGGVFLVTEGLLEEFGPDRVMDTPLSESGIIGFAMGLAMAGLKPIAEIQFVDFIYQGFEELINHVAKLRYRSGGEFTSPLVVRTPYGPGVKVGLYHSQAPESYFIHTPGLIVVVPSSPYNAKGLLKAAVRSQDPVIFLEPKRIYWSPKEEVPDEDYIVQLGKGRVVREGRDVTLVTYGATVHDAVKAAEESTDVADVEVLDLLTLWPLDLDLIISSVRKTGRLVIVHEAPRTLGLGSEIAALIAEKAMEYLVAPIIRVTGPDVPTAPISLEDIYMPTPARIRSGIMRSMKF
ncbi:MAG: alpha-ketoacid dehydrogenase subunit beta [Thermocladium sp.]